MSDLAERAGLSAVLRAPEPGSGPGEVAQARALLANLLYQRLTRGAARLDHDDPAAFSAVRADRSEAIAVSSALLYELPSGGPAWRDVALMIGRLSYDRYRDTGPGAAPPDPDDLDAACDLLMRGVRSDESDERTALYLFLALRDRRRLLATRTDSDALVTWGRRLLTFPEAGGLGRGSLHNMLEAELLTRAESRGRIAAWWIPRQRLTICRYRGCLHLGACLTRDTFRLWPRLRSASCATTGARWLTGWPKASTSPSRGPASRWPSSGP
jgi:hypothetical protein